MLTASGIIRAANILPYAVNLRRFEHDCRGVTDGSCFDILKEEEISRQVDGMVTMGALDCPPSTMEILDGGISVRIELE